VPSLASSADVPWSLTTEEMTSGLANPVVYLLLVAVVVSLGAWVAEGREGRSMSPSARPDRPPIDATPPARRR